MASWQTSNFPSCNSLHKLDLTDIRSNIINSGSYRDVWEIREYNGTQRVLKTLRYQREFDATNFRRHFTDAVAMEQLSSSPYIVDIYSYCSNSAIVDYTSDGDLTRLHTNTHTKSELLSIAHNVAAAVADAHHVDDMERATIVHADIKPNQFLRMGGYKYLLNDFNRARFLKYNIDRNESCGFRETKNWGAVRIVVDTRMIRIMFAHTPHSFYAVEVTRRIFLQE